MRFAVVLLLAVALPAAAGSEEPSNPLYLPQAEQQAWAERLAAAEVEVERLEAKVARLEARKSEAAHGGYPRGEPLADLEHDLELARQALDEARESLPKLVEEARQAGVLPEVLRPYLP